MTLLESMGRLDEADFRVKGRCRHRASEIAVITVCSVISGGTSLGFAFGEVFSVQLPVINENGK